MNRDERGYYSADFYLAEYKKRLKRLKWVKDNPKCANQLKEYYKDKPVEWINDWCSTYDPRNIGTELPSLMPFVLFPKQERFIEWLYDLAFINKRNGVVDKCRDSGATWLGCAFSIWAILHYDRIAIGWGSRKYELVDKKDEPDCIFEKMRQILSNLPKELIYGGVTGKNGLIRHTTTRSTISGEGGDNIGRGGRKTLYFVDEHAFLDHPESVAAALSHNTNVEIDISTHNGTNTLYYRRTKTYAKEDIFIFEWWENPFHDDEWLEKEKRRNDNDGTPWLFEQEVMRNPGGSVPGILIPQKFVRAAIDAHLKLNIDVSGERLIALDVANEGGDLNCAVERHGILVKDCKSWKEGTTTETADRAIKECDAKRIYKLVYEAVGVGAGIKGEAKRQAEVRKRQGLLEIECIGWQPSGEILNKNDEFQPGKKNKDMFQNCNGQAAWDLRERFRKTFENVELGKSHPHDELISLNSGMEELEELVSELSQPKLRDLSITNGKIAIDKKPKGSKSPNRFDSVKIAFARIQNIVISGGSWYSTPSPIPVETVEDSKEPVICNGSYF